MGLSPAWPWPPWLPLRLRPTPTSCTEATEATVLPATTAATPTALATPTPLSPPLLPATPASPPPPPSASPALPEPPSLLLLEVTPLLDVTSPTLPELSTAPKPCRTWLELVFV